MNWDVGQELFLINKLKIYHYTQHYEFDLLDILECKN